MSRLLPAGAGVHRGDGQPQGDGKPGDRSMNKLSVLGIAGGAALLTALPVSLHWSHGSVALSLGQADA